MFDSPVIILFEFRKQNKKVKSDVAVVHVQKL